VGAYQQVKDEEVVPKCDILSRDVQMQYIKRVIWQHKNRIAAA
jgi:hypothetical protein